MDTDITMNDVLHAFNVLKHERPKGYATLEVTFVRYSTGDERLKFQAYSDSPRPTHGEQADDPVKAVRSLMAKFAPKDIWGEM